VVADFAVGRDLIVHVAGREGFHAPRRVEVQGPQRIVQIVAAEVAHRPRAERPEIAPRDRCIGRMERSGLARTEPQIPVEAGWYFDTTFGPARKRLVETSRVYPDMDFMDGADHA